MTTINTVEDFIRVMDSNPEFLEAVRSRLLTRELLELPQRFDRLEDTLQRYIEKTDQRIESLENKFDLYVEKTDQRLEALEDRLSSVEDRLSRLENIVSELAASLKELTASHNTLVRHVDNMRGDHLEMRLQGRIHSLLGARGLYRTRVLRATFPAGSSHEFIDRADDAVMDGVITSEQYQRLMDTDLIVRACRGRDSEQDVYVATEVANLLDAEDINRVTAAGVALARVFPHSEVMTAVYGRAISEKDEILAELKGAEVFLTRDRR